MTANSNQSKIKLDKTNDNSSDSSVATQATWGGRFTAQMDNLMQTFGASIDVDKRMYAEDIDGSIAHATMLNHIGILSNKELTQITQGLLGIKADIEENRFSWSEAFEDVHMNIEQALTNRVGSVGKKLHTGRSRNDQVATDIRLYCKKHTRQISGLILDLQQALLQLASREVDSFMPGFTHLQVAQPIVFAHHMMAWIEMLERDFSRLQDAYHRMDKSPLGCAALAGTSYPIDREMTAKKLGFADLCRNSIDAVSDRDFAIETVSAVSLMMVHLSRMCEEMILWMTPMFGFINIGDAFCTGSSIMPQKKNPDVCELIRGHCGQVIGNLNALLVLMKGQPLAYNRDNQEDKRSLFDALDTGSNCLTIFAAMMNTVTVNRERMYASLMQGHATATEVADYLVRKGLPFRDAHEVVGKVVKIADDKGCDLSQLSYSDIQPLSDLFDQEVMACLQIEGAVDAKSHIGGTARSQVLLAIENAQQRLKDNRNKLGH